jgi:hypothetical protein
MQCSPRPFAFSAPATVNAPVIPKSYIVCCVRRCLLSEVRFTHDLPDQTETRHQANDVS